MISNTRLAAALGSLAVTAGCAHGPRLPMTSAEVRADGTAAALVAYLGQPGADPRVCGEPLPAPLQSAADLPGRLVDALGSGAIPPAAWQDCVTRLLPALEPRRAEDLVSRILGAGPRTLGAEELERDPALQGRVAALERVVIGRDASSGAPEDARVEAREALVRVLGRPDLGPVARGTAGRLLAALDAEVGRWRGRAVNAQVLEELARAGDADALAMLARRLPDAATRGAAERWLVHARIAASPRPELRASPDAVAATVLRLGVNPISLAEHEPVRAWLDPARVPAPRVRVRQEPERGAVKLLAEALDGRVGVLPPVPLRGALQVEVKGISSPITLCEPGRALDPAPCLVPADVAVDGALARLDGDAVRVAEEGPSALAVELARRGGRLEVPIRVAGVGAGALAWPVTFDPPRSPDLEGANGGAAGPDLEVEIERVDADRLVYRVSAPGRATWTAVLERSALATVRVATRGGSGADGETGLDGEDGADGERGEAAACPPFARAATPGGPGAPGGHGGQGGAGGAGGSGGDARVTIFAPPELSADTVSLARATVVSVGGRGGAGGRGGSPGDGGDGGEGGAEASCHRGGAWTTLPEAGDGPSGPDGIRGFDGPPGPDGPPGRVIIDVAAGPRPPS